MIYELRVYSCMPTRKPDVLTRFRDHTMTFFRKYDIDVVGFWEVLIGSQNEIMYMTRFASWEDRMKKWGAFQADQDWQRIRRQTHTNGVLVERVDTKLLVLTDFSPKV